MLVDFSKAYDLVAFDYILECLKFVNFGNTFIGYIKTILNGRTGSIFFNGQTSSNFNFESGSPQGDLISPSLFVICLEPLLIRLLLDEEIERVRTIEGDTLDINVAYADDDSTLVQNSRENLEKVTNIFNEFEMISGLSLNKKKP